METDRAVGKIERYYDENVEREWVRLERHRTEFAVTMRALQDYLPPPPATILDIGGGPGRYAIALARQGYSVTLADLSNEALAFARHKAEEAEMELAGYVHANALYLKQFHDASYDAALIMGPLYHLLTEEERQQALREAWRVLKPGGPIFGAFIGRYAGIRYAAKFAPQLLLEDRAGMERMLSTGLNLSGSEVGFTDSYFIHPTEIRPLMEACGFRTLDMVAAEGIVGRIEERINDLEGELWDAWVDVNYQIGKDPTVQGAAEHLLYVGQRPY